MFPRAQERFERAQLRAAPQGPTKLTAATAVLLALAAASPFLCQAQKSASASVTADLPPGAMQAKATTACLECHEARIILQQRLSKAAWTKEVDKMTKWGAVVDPGERDALIDYLSTNFSPDKPAYEPQRTSGSGKPSK
jgi:mono/diheme cytochrome c family protein